MAKKTKKSKSTASKSTKAKASSAFTAANSTANAYTKAYTKAAKSAATDFMNPSQFFSNTNFGNFQPANVQQWMEQVMETSQKNIEAFTACTQLAVERAKDLLEEQANFTSKLFQEASSTFQETLTSGADPKEKMEEIADYTKYCLEKTATAARKAAEENIQVAQKIGSTLQKRLTDSAEEIRSAAA